MHFSMASHYKSNVVTIYLCVHHVCCVELRISVLHQGLCMQDSWLGQTSLDNCFKLVLSLLQCYSSSFQCSSIFSAGNLSGSHWIDNTLE